MAMRRRILRLTATRLTANPSIPKKKKKMLLHPDDINYDLRHSVFFFTHSLTLMHPTVCAGLLLLCAAASRVFATVNISQCHGRNVVAFIKSGEP